MCKFMHSTTARGFTLIELMIVVAVIAILASIAYPSYVDSVRKARRADAQAEMVQYAGFAERIFTETNSYAGATKVASGIVDNFYNFDINPLTATTFTIIATAQGTQTSDTCGTILSLNNTGATLPTTAGCW